MLKPLCIFCHLQPKGSKAALHHTCIYFTEASVTWSQN